ncbi:Outer membrane usher protein FimD/PapC [Polaromonas sp. YR568]|nr:Outer membrane usher protein FimD/PapC [Polaromonas sp. YR568]
MPAAAWAGGDCLVLGLAPDSRMVMQLREAGHGERVALVFRDRERSGWFVPVLAEPGNEDAGARCTFEGRSYRKFAATDTALRHDADSDLLTVLDPSQATDVIDGRKAPLQQSPALESAGINYQLALNYAENNPQRRFSPSAYADFYAYTGGWYLNNSLAWNNNGRVARYESYALREWLDTGTFLRLGDAVSNPTALGESLQFAGLSWGTDRNLRPGDFAPVLPTLRNGNALAGPLEVFVNDNLQFQQTLQSGVYDLRNLPAQQGFNSYSVRTLDAQGNPVTVQREIYLPVSLLPPGITAWRVDAGFQREDFFTANANYGPGFVSGSYARGITYDVTLSAQGLVSRAASTLSAGYDQRLGDLWTGHLGVITARNTQQGQQQGHALQARLDGGSRWWRLLADWTHAPRALPGLGTRAALRMQRLLRAQWNDAAGWNLGLTVVQTEREPSTREDLATLSASTRVLQSGASVTLSLTRTRFAGVSQDNLMLSLFVPLAPGAGNRNRGFYASHNSTEGAELSRAQYSSSGQTPQDGAWSVGATHDSRPGLSAVDGFWSGSTDKADLNFSGRASRGDNSGQFTLRSGVLWTGGSAYLSRPIRGAFAMVSTGEEGVDVYYENRPMGRTDARGMLLVPELRALELNRLSLNPSAWPIHWLAGEVERQVVPPRGGGVLVSFKINARVWPSNSMVTPLAPGGGPFPAGTVVRAVAEGEPTETVIDRQGRMWLAELLPARVFSITHAGKRCEFDMPDPGGDAEMAVQPRQCEDTP